MFKLVLVTLIPFLHFILFILKTVYLTFFIFIISVLVGKVALGHVVGTPSQDYDDSYTITYARMHDGYVYVCFVTMSTVQFFLLFPIIIIRI